MKALEIFAGPCVLESRDLALTVASELACHQEDIALTFKGSFDKANRTAIDSYRGPGLEEGLRILEDVRRETGLPLVTDYHLPDQAWPVAEVVDVLQVPAFLCRQTDMIVEGAKACQQHGRRLKIKKGQFLAPEQVGHLVDKAATFLPKDKILITERGSSFGHAGLVVDMSSFQIIKSFGVGSVYDVTHSVQHPGGGSKVTRGNRQYMKPLARAALAAGAEALFMEVHPQPEKALSDAATQLPLAQFPRLIRELLSIHQVVGQ